jgi:hypothetical protein
LRTSGYEVPFFHNHPPTQHGVLPFSELVVAAEALNNQLNIKDIHGGIANLIYSFVLFCFCFVLFFLFLVVGLQLRLFQRFCNYDPLRGYMEAELYLYLKTLAKAESKLGVLLPAADAEDGTNFLNCAQLEFLLEEPSFVAQFRGNKDIASGFLQQVAEEHGTLEKASNEVRIFIFFGGMKLN